MTASGSERVQAVPSSPTLVNDQAPARNLRQTSQGQETLKPIVPPCDWCRSQKAKCFAPLDTPASTRKEEQRCRACVRRKQRCTFDYVYKKPGRPRNRTSAANTATSTSPAPSQPPSFLDLEHPSSVTDASSFIGTSTTRFDEPPQASTSHNPMSAHEMVLPPFDIGLQRDSIFGSADFAMDLMNPGYGDVSHESNGFHLPSEVDFLSGAGLEYPSFFPTHQGPGPSAISLPTVSATSDTPSDNSFLLSTSQPAPAAQPSRDPNAAPQIEDIVPWNEFTFFLSLYLRKLHLIAPVVHKPSFALDVLHRRDKTDEAFRGLLFSMVTYSICQCTIQHMSPLFTLEQLESVVRGCQRASRKIQLRLDRRPSVNLLASTLMDWLSCQSMGRYGRALADVLMGEVRRLVYSLKLHLAEPKEDMSVIDRELCRRLFYVCYTTCKTSALNGSPILIHDLEGLPPLPLQIDDEHIFKEGVFSDPAPSHTPILVGFVANLRIFRIISQSIVYQRSLQSDLSNMGFQHHDPDTISRWVDSALAHVRQIINDLPPALKETVGVDITQEDLESSPLLSSYGTQQANLHITALSAEFSLLDLKAMVASDSGIEQAKQDLAKKAYETLSSIPLECIASNGESMRGKVFRTTLSLLNITKDPSDLNEHAMDWWNMYSRVQFLQIMPDIPASGTVTRGASPAP